MSRPLHALVAAARAVPLPPSWRARAGLVLQSTPFLRNFASSPVSGSYVVHDLGPGDAGDLPAWRSADVAVRQHHSYQTLLQQMRQGSPRQDLTVAADAVRHFGLATTSLLEVGCGSGYYSEVFDCLLDGAVKYTGLDYSPAMVNLAASAYPRERWLVGDGTTLPFGDATFEVVLNGVSLMHMLGYREAIRESRRVARRGCIFHSVPVLRGRNTTYLQKRAYGETTWEIIFNETELLDLFQSAGLNVAATWPSVEYNLGELLGEPTRTVTYALTVDQPQREADRKAPA